MIITRRGFLKVVGATAGAAGLGTAGSAQAMEKDEGNDKPGVLVDTTKCVGCRACEAACAEANGNPAPAAEVDFSKPRDTTQHTFTVVNKASTGDGRERFGKKQCMHCIQPACASACPVRAMDKLPTGPVVYDASKCMGCRYCMVACSFDVPKYEYERVAPRVRKCTFCADRQAKGFAPACAEVCPSGALTFGKRGDLLDEAKRRVYAEGSRYLRHVYGEREAGGTSWLYIGDVDFSKLALRTDMPEVSYPELAAGALGVPPFVMTLWPPLLMGLYTFSKGREQAAHGAHGAKKEEHHG